MTTTTVVPEAPPALAAELLAMDAAASAAIPARTERNLLVATWNLRAFSDLTPRWEARSSDTPKRDWHAVACIAAVLSHFDVIAIQEVRRNTTALRFLLARLGPRWHFLTSDVTEGSAGNGERLTYLYDSTRVEPSGLVGEIVLPAGVGDDPGRQFARTPYAASFLRADVEFILTTVHVLWGADADERLPEVEAVARWMRDWADRPDDWNSNLLVLGDFNIDRLDDPLYRAFVATGLSPPPELNGVPRTIFDNDRARHFYDQIAWFSAPDGRPLLNAMSYTDRGGSFDFLGHAFGTLSKNQVSWRISDHYPLWVEFAL
ncbi:endonuclease/exonuclease/phosphatase family protein [Mumia flava]|uniref:Endonuclease/exonuclease/phosphatase family protein n=1 Tax=Mumia flava TaxID=1348852 RepID=A0A0B2B894_9ACTN|nr:endonuclease/exonuclease/phosphatase family protein [Mumia flava]PJJ55900.1 endonuclease/exonuclease/phosphatase family protein [Mumia flava]